VNIILLGPPGAGKGTQARFLRIKLGIPHIGSGDTLRAMVRRDTPLAAELRSYIDRGEFVPDDLMNDVMLSRLSEPDAAHGFILDGFPRTLAQARALDPALAASGHGVDMAIVIQAPDDLIVRRLAGRVICPACDAVYNLQTRAPLRDMVCDVCGTTLQYRSDETPDVVRTRLEVYGRETQPLVDYYQAAHCLVEIDGSRDTVEVQAALSAAVAQRDVTAST
jgi:adenylate kinase